MAQGEAARRRKSEWRQKFRELKFPS